MKIIVLGCGPAGLMAAAGATSAGADVKVVSRKRKSHMFGAQYLHAPIPGYTDHHPIHVRYTLHGTIEGYRDKVYGRDWRGTVSPEELEANHHAWDIRSVYDRLWDAYEPYIEDVNDIRPIHVADMLARPDIDLVISSVPRSIICHEGHTFSGQKIWAAGDAPERDIRIPYSCPHATVICNGIDEVSWYRLSNIFGHKTVEWSQESVRSMPPINTAAEVIKPTHHNCTCFRDIVHVGRYGRWEKGVLSDSAFREARRAVEQLSSVGVQSSLPGLGD
jgi:hypothetical protein